MRVLALSFLLATLPLGADAAPGDPAGLVVLVSIKPIYSIVAQVMQGSGRISVLLRGAASPDTYALRPSDTEKIARADVIFWVGPALERFLVVPLANLAPPCARDRA
jgi:zinc transport system substrate-binding protein